MLHKLKHFFAPPNFPDDEKTRSAGFINALVLTNIPFLVLFIIIRTVAQAGVLFGTANLILVIIIAILTLAWFLMRSGWVTLAGYLHVTTIWLATTIIALMGNGINGSTFASYFVVMLVAGLLLGWKPALGYTFVSILAVFSFANEATLNIAIEGTVLLIFGAIFLYLIINSLQNAVLKAQETAAELRTNNQQLRDLRDALEVRVEERTAALGKRAGQLEAISELAQSIAQVQNPNEIFSVAANLISERFGFYHVGIFLIDRDREYAVLQAANSEGGQKMLGRGHRLMLGTGVVGFAAQTGKPRLAFNVGEDVIFFNNPDLPETRSEIALPLTYGEKAIGVLDVQSMEPGAFSEEDFRVLGTLANQLAIAIENARLLSEARASARQLQEVYNEFVRTQWSRSEQKMDYTGFRYNGGRIEILESIRKEIDEAPGRESNNRMATPVEPSKMNRGKITVPVKLRGEVIGVLNIESNDSTKRWSADERSLMEAVAERAALALENARLFQDARRRAAKERMIAEATSNISSSMNIENILEATATELERVLGGSEVLIRFNSKDSG